MDYITIRICACYISIFRRRPAGIVAGGLEGQCLGGVRSSCSTEEDRWIAKARRVVN